jgi:hypothetical protein
MSKSMASSTVYFANDGDFEDNDQFESLVGGTRQRRIGGNQAYRDDRVRNHACNALRVLRANGT